MRVLAARFIPIFLVLGSVIGALNGMRPVARTQAVQVQVSPPAPVYVVQEGDTLAEIAAHFGLPLHLLASANLLSDDATLGAGMMLLIPPTPLPTATGNAGFATNTPEAPTIASPAFATNTTAPSATPLPTDAATFVIVTPHVVTLEATDGTSNTLILPNLDAPMPGPELLNDIPISQIIVMDEQTRANVRAIFAQGQALGRNPRAFSKLGDSTIESPYFLDRFDAGNGSYNLGAFGYLQPLIDYFQGSFSRQGVAVIRGLHTWSVFDPMWANDYYCQPNEDMLECEFRIHNPAYLFVRLGSNDVGAPTATERNLREVIEFSIANGVIPIMGTKADRHDGPYNTNNEIIRSLADEYNLPLWDFDLIAGTLPGRGVGGDSVHLTTWYAHDYTNPEAFRRGYGVHNLTALIALYQTWLVVLTVPPNAAVNVTGTPIPVTLTPIPTATVGG